MNQEGAKLHKYAAEFCPRLVASLDNPDLYFEELGTQIAQTRKELIEMNRRPECGSRDLATELMVEEVVKEMYYPPPESEELSTTMFSTETFDPGPKPI